MSEFTGEGLKREILNRIEYQGLKLNGTVEFSNSFDGDILSMVYRLLNEPDELKQRITELEEENKWISVDDRLPEIDQWVNVLCDLDSHLYDSSITRLLNPDRPSKSVTCANLRMVTKSGWAEWSQGILGSGRPLKSIDYVTHWKPLPSTKENN